MAQESKPRLELLRWSEHVPASDVQDPLGLSLRGSARLASRLLFCITSITPRARYFSFLPWCVLDWQTREKGQRHALGLSRAIALRERALVLGSVAHHDGKACPGGGLVGSESVAKWFHKGETSADLRKLPFAKNPALDAYWNSLVNLGFFVTEEKDEDEPSEETEEEVAQTFDDSELSPLGMKLARAYEQRLGRLEAVGGVSTLQRRCSVASLGKWGERGGLCELAEPGSPDRDLLRQVFFGQGAPTQSSHFVRNRSLLLILELARQLSAADWVLNESTFGSAVYFGRIVERDEEPLEIRWPKPLIDIAMRWRMFYFHHYLSVALEGMFAWLVTRVGEAGIGGASVKELSESLNSSVLRKELRELLGIKLAKTFGRSTPLELLMYHIEGLAGFSEPASKRLDRDLLPPAALAEEHLEEVIRDKGFAHLSSGLAVSLALLGTTLARYSQWEGTDYGNWLASASSDPYVDLVPPVLTAGLSRRFGSWWGCPWTDVAEFVISRYVVQQHQSMSYEKTAKGDRCLLQFEGSRISTEQNEVYEKIGMGNGRFRSAAQVLVDLGLLTERPDRVKVVTNDGAKLLRDELARAP
jgi:hypothetical protein